MFCRNMQRDAALRAELDEMRALERRFGEQDAVVGEDADGIAVDVGKAGDQGGAIALPELVQPAAVHHAGDHLAHVVRLARVGRHDAVDLLRVEERFLRRGLRPAALGPVQIRNDAPHERERVRIVVGKVIGHAGDAGVHVGAAQLFGGDFLAGGRLHQRRAAQKDGALVLHDDGLIGHRRAYTRHRRCTSPSRRRSAGCRRPRGSPGCRRWRPKCSRSGNTSSCRGRKAPPESTR